MIKAIIFDMDGVLIDAKEWHYEALNRALAIFGYGIERSEHLGRYDGLPTAKKLLMLSDSQGLPVRLHQFINDLKQRITLEIVYERCKPNFIHEYALSQLKAKGYQLSVASNSVRVSVDTMLRLAALDGYLDFTLSNEDVTLPKPDPEVYLTAIQRLGLNPKEVLILEDNDHGIKAARASGAHVLEIGTVDDVNYANIAGEIARIEGTDQ